MTTRNARGRSGGTRFSDVRRHREVGSTNQLAAELARLGAPEGVVVVADHQTAGRGRRGRSWDTRPGSSLLVSVLTRPAPGSGPTTLVTVACGMAAADACLAAAGFLPGLKWPNDLVVGGHKVGGILAEVVAGGANPPAVVLGLGLNVTGPVPVPGAVAADEVTERPVDRDELLAAFLDRLELHYARLSNAAGRHRVLDEFRGRCVTLGRDVRILRPGAHVLEGRATDVTPAGSLVVSADDRTEVVSAGDVDHVRPGDHRFR